MKLFVTGGAGFIGSNFILKAIERGDTVLNFDALTYAGNLANLESVSANDRYTFVHGNICDRAAIEAAVKSDSFDACINFAAESHVDRSIAAANIFAETNILGAVRLAEVMREASVPMFLQISTDEVYGSADHGKMFRLDSKIKPSSPYAASKAAADHMVLSFHYTHGYDVRVTRCTNNYGRFQFPEKFVPTIITRALSGERVPVYGDGKQIRDWIAVEDHCDGIFRVIDRGTSGEVYLFGGSSEVMNLDLATLVLERIAEKQNTPKEKMLALLEHVKDRAGHDRRYAIDWSATETAIGWRPKIDFATGIRATVDWYLNNEGWWQALMNKANANV
ncbi:MAG: dTDP-glucose 4,6-dehydratase [Candidatus Kapaibacterium sp.]